MNNETNEQKRNQVSINKYTSPVPGVLLSFVS